MRFISFDKDYNIIAEDIVNSARFIYDNLQKYFIKGNPTPNEEASILLIKEFYDLDLSRRRKTKS